MKSPSTEQRDARALELVRRLVREYKEGKIYVADMEDRAREIIAESDLQPRAKRRE